MSKKTLTLYEFEEFRLDANQKCLWHSDEMVSLTPKALETLLVLIKHRGEIVSKDVLLDEVWADTFVEESTLSQNILTLRKTFSAFQKDKQFIVTVPRRGFRFVADVKEIVGDEEIFVVEKRTRTHIIAEQQEIHDSAEKTEIANVKNTKTFSNKKLFAGFATLTLILLVSGFFVTRYFFNTQNFAESKFQKFRVGNIASGADLNLATISPNGKYVALVEKKAEKQRLILKETENSNTIEVVTPTDTEFIGVTFSKESDQIYYSAYTVEKNNPIKIGKLSKVSILGGASNEIVQDIDSPAALSPDEKQIAFIRRDLRAKETVLIIADIDGKNEKKLTSRKFGEGFANHGLSWSPDGKHISCSARRKNDLKNPMELTIIETANGEQKPLTPNTWQWIGQSAWLKDGSGIAVVAYGSQSPNLTDEIWIVSYPEGKARLVSNGLNGIFGVSLTNDVNEIVTATLNRISSLNVSSLENLDESTEISKIVGDKNLLPLGADFTPDGKIVYSQIQNGNADIWIMSVDGTDKKQLTSEQSAEINPAVSSDGKFIVFISNRLETSDVWRTDINGTNQKQLSEGKNAYSPNISPDGKWVFYTAPDETATSVLWKVPIDGGDTVKVTEKFADTPKVSPDGKNIACFFPSVENTKQIKLTILSSENGVVVRQFDLPKNQDRPLFEWKNDSQNLYIVLENEGKTSLWQQPINEKEPTQIKVWQKGKIFRFAVSKDNKQVFFEEGTEANSVLLLQNIE